MSWQNHHGAVPRIDAAEVASWLPLALEFAERERESIARSAAVHGAAQRERGKCYAGHDLPTVGAIPRHAHNGAPCGYCSNQRTS